MLSNDNGWSRVATDRFIDLVQRLLDWAFVKKMLHKRCHGEWSSAEIEYLLIHNDVLCRKRFVNY